MASEDFSDVFTAEVLNRIFPAERADSFFDALYGDASEGAYDISLNFKAHRENRLEFELHLSQRPGKCITCSLTYGLPEVFKRHPIININGLVQEIGRLLDGRANCINWQIGFTREVTNDRHVIPLSIQLD